ncbi:MAG: arsenate reductase (glutaredoxin) [Burkholderiaceae bacterium]
MSTLTLYHNPRCSTSRQALALLRERGTEPVIVEYLKTPPDRATLQALVKASGVPLREFLRSKEDPYKALDLGRPGVSDDELIDAVLSHPVLLQRPIAVTAAGVRIGRPPERVLELL